MLPLPVPSDEDAAVEEVVVDVVGKGGARVVAAALLATTAGFEDVEAGRAGRADSRGFRWCCRCRASTYSTC